MSAQGLEFGLCMPENFVKSCDVIADSFRDFADKFPSAQVVSLIFMLS